MISRFFIDRPIFATVLSVVITLIGGIALYWLPIAQYPRITPPGVSVSINYPGASAPVVADTVAAPIEQQVNGVEGMLYMSSQMGNDGSYSLTVTFDIGTDVNTALVMVQNRVALAMPQLPTQVQNQGITIRKKTPDMLMIVNFFSPDGRYDDIYLSNFATIYVKDELLRVDGVSDINYMGQRDYSIRAWLDPQKLASRSMTAMDVASAIRSQNVDAPVRADRPAAGLAGPAVPVAGRHAGPAQRSGAVWTIVVKAGRSSPEEPATGIVRLRDVARIEMGAQNYNQSCTFDGHPSVGLSVYQLPGTNALDVADRVRAKMEELKTRFPDGVDYDIAYDTTPFIRESVCEVFKTLRDAVILVGLVVLVFLQDWRAMILPMIDVPVSLIGTFAVMAALGFSLNNISLFGLVLAIGIVVDDAIVVLENIERMIAKGFDARTATIKAMEEITGPILAITLVLCAVFVPCCFLGGITGQFFRQFAVTIAVSTIISAINAADHDPVAGGPDLQDRGGEPRSRVQAGGVALVDLRGGGGAAGRTGTGQVYLAGRFGLPAVSSGAGEAEASGWMSWAIAAAYFAPGAVAGGAIGWFVIRPVNAVLGWLFRGFNRLFDVVTVGYGWTVGKLLRISVVVLLVYGGLVVLTYWVFQHAPTGFIPQQDQGRLIVSVQLPDSASLQRTKEAMAQVDEIARETPGVAHTVAIAGMSFLLQANASNFGSMFIVLDPFDKRQGPRAARRGHHGPAAAGVPEAGQGCDGQRAEFLADPGPGRRRRLQDHGRGPRRPGTGGLAEPDRRADPETAGCARSGRRSDRVPLQHAADLPGHRPDQGRVALGVSFEDVNQTLSMYPGLALRQQLQRIRPPLAGHRPGRGRVPQPDRGHQPVPGPEQVGADGPAGHAGQREPAKSDRAARSSSRATTSTRPRRSPGTCGRGSAPATPSRRSTKLAGESLPLSMKAEWTELMFVQIRAAERTPRSTSSGWRSSASSWRWRRSTRAGRCRWRSSWWCRCACSVP